MDLLGPVCRFLFDSKIRIRIILRVIYKGNSEAYKESVAFILSNDGALCYIVYQSNRIISTCVEFQNPTNRWKKIRGLEKIQDVCEKNKIFYRKEE
ncbi:hypothetical protein TNCV_4128031 [Trichonephila clavipes]|uniref:Uncharacterized protein n=1 Tax=Trichonephila clavipes TaxID=2585209 RepID=A0A8X6T3M0_TRICX|nr:hypothetical protein TNCV_4128031 [Trichonephila clavipes]